MTMMSRKFRGIVKAHSRDGTKFGYPTANILIDDKSLEGIFAGYTYLIKSGDTEVKKAFGDKPLPSVVFAGAPETLREKQHRLESHILDFPEIDLYGSEISVEIIEKLRGNEKFDTVENLITQMEKDEAAARKYFAGMEN